MALFNPSRDEVRAFFFETWHKFAISKPLSFETQKAKPLSFETQKAKLLTPLEQLALQVMQMHPEYHAILNQPDLYREQAYYPELGETNPFLHMSLHLSILEQLSINQPIGIAGIYQLLLAKYQDAHSFEHKAQHDILDCLGETIWLAQRNNAALDSAHYVQLMQQKAGLPAGN